MNRYNLCFHTPCPNNGERIEYRLQIESKEMIQVEDLIAATTEAKGYHEQIADLLHTRFGGHQTMTATHGGVLIETTRPT